MGWVVEDIVCRWRRKLGRYNAFEWPRFLDDTGLRYQRADMPISLPALIIGRTIVVHRDLDRLTTAWLVWHEAGHYVAHCGNREAWRRMACGDLILAKMERQASEFALLFPDWE